MAFFGNRSRSAKAVTRRESCPRVSHSPVSVSKNPLEFGSRGDDWKKPKSGIGPDSVTPQNDNRGRVASQTDHVRGAQADSEGVFDGHHQLKMGNRIPLGHSAD